jgi:tRNA threonylcarbamoyladenosine biosynthesis protein TsaE
MEKEIKSVEEMYGLAEAFVRELVREKSARVVALKGDLGSGKTTFTQGVAKTLGVKEDITSPTFVILKNYELKNQVFNTLVHIDAYRLENHEELSILNWNEILEDESNLILIEWPENVAEALPKNTQQIDFNFVNENTRNVTIK